MDIIGSLANLVLQVFVCAIGIGVILSLVLFVFLLYMRIMDVLLAWVFGANESVLPNLPTHCPSMPYEYKGGFGSLEEMTRRIQQRVAVRSADRPSDRR